jgi:hypothetical protein
MSLLVRLIASKTNVIPSKFALVASHMLAVAPVPANAGNKGASSSVPPQDKICDPMAVASTTCHLALSSDFLIVDIRPYLLASTAQPR